VFAADLDIPEENIVLIGREKKLGPCMNFWAFVKEKNGKQVGD